MNIIQPEVVEWMDLLDPTIFERADNLHCSPEVPYLISSQEQIRSPRRILWEDFEELYPFESSQGARPAPWCCIHCPSPMNYEVIERSKNHPSVILWNTERCSDCNTKKSRDQRATRAFEWLQMWAAVWDEIPKLLTISPISEKSPEPFSEESISKIREKQLKDFQRMRESQAWPQKSCGIWVFEATSYAPGDVVWCKKTGKELRRAEAFEFHGHIHAAIISPYIDREPILDYYENRIGYRCSGS